MRELLLVRHSAVTLDPAVPANRWRLSDEGRRRARVLAQWLAAHDPVAVVTSVEPKAVETGRIAAGVLGIPCRTMAGLHEHERPQAGLAPRREVFQAQVARLLRHPHALVFGAETGEAARRRFAHAIDRVLAQHPAGSVVVVTHGTVLALFVAGVTGIDPVPFWLGLGLPALAVLSLPGFDLRKIVEDAGVPPAAGAPGVALQGEGA
jgi:broad specificity phosphatase PhoE